MGLDYASLTLENTGNGFTLSQQECAKAEKGGGESVNASISLTNATVYLRMKVNKDATCSFSYSIDDKKYTSIGRAFTIKEGKWIGAKIGMFCSRPIKGNDGGRVDIDWFRVTK